MKTNFLMFPVPMKFLVPWPVGDPLIDSRSRSFPFSKFIPVPAGKIFPVRPLIGIEREILLKMRFISSGHLPQLVSHYVVQLSRMGYVPAVMATVVMCSVGNPAYTAASTLNKERYIIIIIRSASDAMHI